MLTEAAKQAAAGAVFVGAWMALSYIFEVWL